MKWDPRKARQDYGSLRPPYDTHLLTVLLMNWI